MSKLDPFGLHAPFLDSMPKSARLAFPFVEALAPSPLSANAILRHLTENGIGIGRSTGLALIRHLRGQTVQHEYVKSIRLNALPNPERLPFSSTNTLRTYSYTVQVTGNHSFTGEKMQQYITISSHNLLTKQQAINTAAGYIIEDQASYQMIATDFVVTKIHRNPSMPIT